MRNENALFSWPIYDNAPLIVALTVCVLHFILWLKIIMYIDSTKTEIMTVQTSIV